MSRKAQNIELPVTHHRSHPSVECCSITELIDRGGASGEMGRKSGWAMELTISPFRHLQASGRIDLQISVRNTQGAIRTRRLSWLVNAAPSQKKSGLQTIGVAKNSNHQVRAIRKP